MNGLESVARAGQASPELTCPVCGKVEVTFHSEISVLVGGKTEKTAVFLCPLSHTFFIPYCSLRPAKGPIARLLSQ